MIFFALDLKIRSIRSRGDGDFAKGRERAERGFDGRVADEGVKGAAYAFLSLSEGKESASFMRL